MKAAPMGYMTWIEFLETRFERIGDQGLVEAAVG